MWWLSSKLHNIIWHGELLDFLSVCKINNLIDLTTHKRLEDMIFSSSLWIWEYV